MLVTNGLQIPVTNEILKSGGASKIYHLGRLFNEGGFLFQAEGSSMKVNVPDATIDQARINRGTSKFVDNNAVDMVLIEKSSNGRLTDSDRDEVFDRSIIIKTAYEDLNRNFPGQMDLMYDGTINRDNKVHACFKRNPITSIWQVYKIADVISVDQNGATTVKCRVESFSEFTFGFTSGSGKLLISLTTLFAAVLLFL